MKLLQVSDIHLEFDPDFRIINPGADVLVLGGDICVANKFTKGEDSPYYQHAQVWKDFFRQCSEDFADTVYIMGNHEHYSGRFDLTVDIMRTALADFSNIHILDNQSIELHGFLIIGSTLWTNVNKSDPIAESIIRFAMNDYKLIQVKDGNTYRKLQPFDTIKAHQDAVRYITDNASLSDKVIVLTHHAPTYKSIHEKYNNKDDYHINFAYASDLERTIESLPQIKLWTHGHVHNSFEYQVGNCRVLCNPKGYRNENKQFNPGKVIEVE